MHRGRPAAKYSQAVRLLNLYDRANRGEILRPSDALADSLCIDKRTLQRDLAILREIGKLHPADGPTPGWCLPKAARNWGMDIWSVLGVLLGARAIAHLAGAQIAGQVAPLLSQLRRSLPLKDQHNLDDLEHRVHVTESGQKLYRQQPRQMQTLQAMVDGLLRQRPIELTYLSPRQRAQGSAPRPMRVQALCLVLHRGGVYLVVDLLNTDTPHETRRLLLSLDRIESVRVETDAAPCTYPLDFRPSEYFESAFGIWNGTESHHVRLRVDPLYASAVRERAWHATQTLEQQPDGSVILTMQLGALEEVTEWVLGMGEHVRVETPHALIERVRLRLEQALAQYLPPQKGDAT